MTTDPSPKHIQYFNVRCDAGDTNLADVKTAIEAAFGVSLEGGYFHGEYSLRGYVLGMTIDLAPSVGERRQKTFLLAGGYKRDPGSPSVNPDDLVAQDISQTIVDLLEWRCPMGWRILSWPEREAERDHAREQEFERERERKLIRERGGPPPDDD